MKEAINLVCEMMEWLLLFLLAIFVGILAVIMIAAISVGYVLWILLVTVVMVFSLLQGFIIGIFEKHK